MTLWRGKRPLILASQSSARQALLANAGIDFEAVPADIDEREIQLASGLSAPGDIAALLARRKALRCRRINRADLWSAQTRHWPGPRGFLQSRPVGPKLQNSCAP
jgi:predicted house-cleaning NTP pyrophosphatase (Maf/HAM1 superfamily)